MGNKFVPIGIIIIAILSIAIIKPLALDIRMMNAQATAFAEQSTLTNNKINKLNELKPKLSQYKTTIDDIKMAMPAAQQIPEVLVMVESIAQNTGLNISGFDIQPGSSGNEVGVNMSASGTYDNLSGFTSKLENNVRPIRIKTMSVSAASADSQQISVSVSFGILYQGKLNQQVASQIN